MEKLFFNDSYKVSTEQRIFKTVDNTKQKGTRIFK